MNRPTASPGRPLRRAFRAAGARWGLAIILLLALVAVFADFIAPYRYDAQNETLSLTPPTRLHFRGDEGFSWRPFVYATQVMTSSETFARTAIEDPSRAYSVRFFVHGFRYRLLGLFSTDIHLFGVEARDGDAVLYLFGADRLGRDLFSRTVYGARVSLLVGPLVLVVLFPLAMFFGGLSGYYGGWIDRVLQRFGEFATSLPSLPIVLVVGAALAGRGTPALPSFLAVILALAAVSWAGVARVVRGQVLSIRRRAFVLAARSSGASDLKILVSHILPHASSYLAVAGALLIPGMMLMEASLSFLGLGVREPMTSWGALLAGARSVAALETSPWLLIPGGFIIAGAFAFQLVGDALRDALDPWSRVGSGR
jgi:peptide/nickel transport system permease protein